MTSTTLSTSEHTEQVAREVQTVLDEDWYWFPVRHHSASVAFLLDGEIRRRRPKLILIEGPAEADHLIPHLVNRRTRPPVAIYSCFQDDSNQFGLAGLASPAADIPPRWACWSPFVEYSPEFVAIRTAARLQIPVKFMDLPHYGRLAHDAARLLNRPDPDSTPPADGDASEDNSEDASRHTQTEQLIAESSFYQQLAEAGGYTSWDQGWDALFEFRDFADTEHFRREMLTFCCAARGTTSSQRIAIDGTLERERYMLQTIRREVAAAGVSDHDVMIVCGGFHAFLDRNDPELPPELPEGTVYTTVVPYTNFRISSLSGYGAGNRAPQFYQLFWDARNGRVANPETEYVVSVIKQARKRGESLSSADAISVSQHSRMLAALRGRERPLLDDLHDALMTCCCKGSPQDQGVRLQEAMDQVDIGTKIGRVAADAKRLPLVDDFYGQLDRLNLRSLTEQERRETIELDKREADQSEQSAFLHRLHFLEVPFAAPESRPDAEFSSGLIFRERWGVRWTPQVEARLIDQTLLGDTVETAVITLLRRRMADNSDQAGEICRTLVAAMQMNLPQLIDQVFDVAVTAIDEDPRFVSLCEAVAQLAVLDRYALHHELKRDQIARMSERAFARACFAMPEIAAAPDDRHMEIVRGLMTLADHLQPGPATNEAGDDSSNSGDDRSQLFSQFVAATLELTQIPYLRGALTGLAVEIRLQSPELVTDEILSFARSGQEQMIHAGDFIHGVISVSRASLMTGSGELVDAIDALIRAADWDTFVTMLPRLRAGMEMLHARHRDSLAARVAELCGLAESASLRQLDVSVETAAAVAAIDRQVADVMSHWSFAD